MYSEQKGHLAGSAVSIGAPQYGQVVVTASSAGGRTTPAHGVVRSG